MDCVERGVSILYVIARNGVKKTEKLYSSSKRELHGSRDGGKWEDGVYILMKG
jgi:hypothetical protein